MLITAVLWHRPKKKAATNKAGTSSIFTGSAKTAAKNTERTERAPFGVLFIFQGMNKHQLKAVLKKDTICFNYLILL